MEVRDDNEKLIGKLIKKRKEETEAFMKLLRAIETKSQTPEEKPQSKSEQIINHKPNL